MEKKETKRFSEDMTGQEARMKYYTELKKCKPDKEKEDLRAEYEPISDVIHDRENDPTSDRLYSW